MRTIVTYRDLKKWGIRESSICTRCDEQLDETLEHMFFSCPYTQKIYGYLTEYCEDRFNIDINIELSSIILNDMSTNEVINLLFLLAKQKIYATRCLGTEVTAQLIIKQFENFEKYERYRIGEGKLEHHCQKWSSAIVNNDMLSENNVDSIQEYVNNYFT